jgi:hypothetical protein
MQFYAEMACFPRTFAQGLLSNLGGVGQMSVAEIQRAVVSIRDLSAKDRARISHWAMAEIGPEAVYADFDQACEGGYYDAIIAATDEEYERGEALSKIY